tara:strand:- start:196 stop:321 length:126 start_codon:yes stop_codon:yes gene_type:complete
MGSLNPALIPVLINNVSFVSIKEAMNKLNKTRRQIKQINEI